MTAIDFMLVTVGTTSFDDLVRAADAAAGELCPNDGLIQSGEGVAVPVHLPHRAFVPQLSDLVRKASVVVAHGGAATTFEVLRAGVPLVSVANGDRYDDHQIDLLGSLADAGHLTWCRDLGDLATAVRTAMNTPAVPLPSEPCTIGAEIASYLAGFTGQRSLRRRLRLRSDHRSGSI